MADVAPFTAPLTGTKLRQALLLAWETRAKALELKPRSKKREAAFLEWISGVRIGLLAASGGLLDPNAKTEIDMTVYLVAIRGESVLAEAAAKGRAA